jgi:hypothetical protein
MVSEFDRLNDDNLRGRFELGRDQAKRYATDALKLAPKFTDDPNFGTAIYTANMTLSALALRDGDRKASVLHLERAAGHLPPSSWRAATTWCGTGLCGTSSHKRAPGRDRVLERMARTSVALRIELRRALRFAATWRRSEG